MTDLEIVARCQNGQLDYFWEIYEKYVDEIYKFIYLKTFDRELSEDLCSQTFFKALDKIHTFKIDIEANLRAWIYRIAYNGIIDEYKKNRQKIELSEVLELWYEKDFASDIDNKKKLQDVFAFFDALNPRHKEILIMRLWDDLSYQEIAELTGEKLDNCKKIVSRTLSKIPQETLFLFVLLLWSEKFSHTLFLF